MIRIESMALPLHMDSIYLCTYSTVSFEVPTTTGYAKMCFVKAIWNGNLQILGLHLCFYIRSEIHPADGEVDVLTWMV